MLHLHQHTRCRCRYPGRQVNDLVNWRNTYAALRNKAYLEKPGVKEKYQKMLESIKKGEPCLSADVAKSGQKADRNKEIGTPAGDLWNLLAKEKIIRVADIPQKLVKYDIDQALGAYGWLTRKRLRLSTTISVNASS